MIFILPKPARMGIWMKDTHIPLDVIFVASNKIVSGVEYACPESVETLVSQSPVKWVIELLHGQAEAAGLRPGDLINL